MSDQDNQPQAEQADPVREALEAGVPRDPATRRRAASALLRALAGQKRGGR